MFYPLTPFSDVAECHCATTFYIFPICFLIFCSILIQFEKENFDAVLDKGGLDALMEPELGSKLGNQYLSEVFLL